MPVGNAAQRGRGIGMRLFRITKVRDRVALEAVRTALKNNEFRRCVLEIALNTRPLTVEIRIFRAGCDRNIELGAARPAGAGLLGSARARIQKAAVLVDIGEQQVRVVFKTIKHAITVVRVNIDVGDPPEAVVPAQIFDRHTAIIEYTKPGSLITCRVVQTCDGHEGAFAVTVHHGINRRERGAHNVAGGLKYAGDRRRVAVIEVAPSLG